MESGKAVFIFPVLSSAVLLLGMLIGFLWKWEPNIGLEVMLLSMFLALLTVAFQLLMLRPRLSLGERQKAIWTLLAISPLVGVGAFLALTGGLYALVSLLQGYINKHGV